MFDAIGCLVTLVLIIVLFSVGSFMLPVLIVILKVALIFMAVYYITKLISDWVQSKRRGSRPSWSRPFDKESYRWQQGRRGQKPQFDKSKAQDADFEVVDD